MHLYVYTNMGGENMKNCKVSWNNVAFAIQTSLNEDFKPATLNAVAHWKILEKKYWPGIEIPDSFIKNPHHPYEGDRTVSSIKKEMFFICMWLYGRIKIWKRQF